MKIEKKLSEQKKRRLKIYRMCQRMTQQQVADVTPSLSDPTKMITSKRVGQICAMVETELKAGEK